MTTRQQRSTEGFTTLDDFLGEDGTREAFQAVAVNEVLAFQSEEVMKARKFRLPDY